MKKPTLIRTRFAPSPTGYLHLGGARTALYNWLFTCQNLGIFILRIEDTDTERSTPEAVQQIMESMAFLGLDFNEGPFFQSERLDIYNSYVDKLLEQDRAYEQEGAVYIRADKSSDILFEDIILGKIRTPADELKDFVIRKSNGWPIYHFSCVVDDYLMNITHVIRGMDHVTNTSKQLIIYNALDFLPPQFAHIPLILGPDKQRLSKRHGATGVDAYEKQGFLAEAMLNFLARLGWGYENQEIFTVRELIEKFDLTKVSKSPAVFDLKKLEWINNQHIKQADIHDLSSKLTHLSGIDYSNYQRHIQILRDRCYTLPGLIDQLNRYIKEPESYDEKGVEKYIKDPEKTFSYLILLANRIDQDTDFTCETLETLLRGLADELGIKASELIHPSRLALTGITVGPGIFDVMALLGKDQTVHRLKRFEQAIKKIGVNR
ncbi:glutamate--tRNA ligase [Thermoproteota archaeon]